MKGKILARRKAGLPAATGGNISDIFEDWIVSRSANTKINYLASIKKFSAWCENTVHGCKRPAFIWLYSLSGMDANRVALRFREWMREQNLSAHTVNNRLAALRAFASLLHAVGVTPWTFAVKDLPMKNYRDTKGPDLHGVRMILQVAAAKPAPRGIRDEVVVLLLYTLGLRASELCALNVEDIDLVKRRVHVKGKGMSHKEWATLPAGVFQKILSWLEERSKYAPAGKGPLILSFANSYDTSAQEDRMGRFGIYWMIQRLGKHAGIPGLHPHSLRHSAITEVLRSNNGNIAKAMRFSRHKDPKTVMVYEDNLEDAPGEAAGELTRRILEEKSGN
jgi:integrase/recombinase XerC